MKKVFCFICLVVLGVAGVTSGSLWWDGVAAGAEGCVDVEFIWARGSGQEFGRSKELSAYEKWVANHMEWEGLAAKWEITELDYPAIEVDAVVGAKALVSAGDGFEFGESVRKGKEVLKSHIKKEVERCPKKRFVLTGYSQGALVMAESLRELDVYKVIYVALLGDPKLHLPEGRVPFWPIQPDACSGKNKSSYRAWAPNCYTHEGALGSRRPYIFSNAWEGKVGLYCNNKDFICGSSKNPLDNDGHMAYTDIMTMVTSKIVSKVASALPQKIQAQRPSSFADLAERQAPMDTVIMLDSTGSMANMLNSFKKKAAELAAMTVTAGGRVALVEYRDQEDVGFPRMLCGFGCGKELFDSLLSGVSAKGGGDEDEGLLRALMMAMESLDWREGATKSVIVLTDAGYHSPDKSGVTYQQVVDKSLSIDPVNVYVIGKKEIGSLVELAEDTGGMAFWTGSSGTLSTSLMDKVTARMVGRPVALLALVEYWAGEGESLWFDASMSYGVGGEITQYDWDFDGDGVYEVLGGEAAEEWTYEGEFDGFVVVRVSDETGSRATMSARVRVGVEPPMSEEYGYVVPEVGGEVEMTTETVVVDVPGVVETVAELESPSAPIMNSREVLGGESLLPGANLPGKAELQVPDTGLEERDEGVSGVAIGLLVLIMMASVGVIREMVAWRRPR